MFFIPRSEYFRAILDDPFNEAQGDIIPAITLNALTINVFVVIIHYLYCNQILVRYMFILFFVDLFLSNPNLTGKIYICIHS